MGNYSYITEWKTAIERTERFGLKLPECRLQSEKRYLTPQFIQEFPYILQKELGVIEKNEVISQCLTFHLIRSNEIHFNYLLIFLSLSFFLNIIFAGQDLIIIPISTPCSCFIISG